jgi:hypothetical protein
MTGNNHRRSQGTRGRTALWVGAVVFICAVGVLGAALVSTAPLDDQGRNNLGVGLLAGVVVGAALIVVGYALDKQRRANEEEQDERQRQGLLEYARGRLARLVQQYARELEWRTYRALQDALPAGSPPHFRGREDVRTVWRSILWISDIDQTDPHWYRDPATVECVDLTLLVSSHIIERHGGGPAEPAEFERLEFFTEDTASRLSGTADILSQLRSPDRAQRLADVSSTIQLAAVTLSVRDALGAAGVPPLPRVELDVDEDGVTHLEAPDAGTQFISQFLAYVVDLLQHGFGEDRAAPSPLVVGSRRLIDSPDDDGIVRHRWPSLIRGSEAVEGLWAERYADGSWLRKALKYGSERASWSWGVDSNSPERTGTLLPGPS